MKSQSACQKKWYKENDGKNFLAPFLQKAPFKPFNEKHMKKNRKGRDVEKNNVLLSRGKGEERKDSNTYL